MLLGAALAYLLLAVVLWWQVWSSDPASVTTCGCGDSSLFTWFLAWPAWAIAHGHSVLWSRALFHPQGVNLLANTSELAFGVPLAPVTWLWGPIATLDVALTLSPALTAFACFALLRRWVGNGPVAFLGGLVYGFSPFVVVNLSDAHLMDGTLLVLPLAVLALDELLVGSRLRPVTVGVLLGLLAAVQFFLGTELLVITAMGIAVGLVLVLAWSLARSRDLVRRRWRRVAVGLAAAAVTGVVLLAYPAWFALAGPSHFGGLIWPQLPPRFGGVALRSYVDTAGTSPSLLALSHVVGGYQGRRLGNPVYLGWPLLGVVLAGLVLFRRDRRLWLATAVGALCASLTVQVFGHPFAPWRLFGHLPVLEDIVPSRFLAVVDLCATVAVAIVADRVGSWASGRWGRRQCSVAEPTRLSIGTSAPSIHGAPLVPGTPLGHGQAPRAGRAGRAIGALASLAVVAVAFVPIAAQVVPDSPLTAVRVAVPQWFAHPQPGAGPGDVVLTIPAPFTLEQGAMTWQAVAGFRYSLVGGGGPGSVPARSGRAGPAVAILQRLATPGGAPLTLDPRAVAELDAALTAWQATTVVIVDQPDLPRYDQPVGAAPIAALLTAAIGRSPRRAAGAWVWTGVASRHPRRVPEGALAACADADRTGPAGVGAVATCVLVAASRSG
ncbi:MAG: hypothetical protein ACP5P9_00525 [Acidimicrobiales bacterium]